MAPLDDKFTLVPKHILPDVTAIIGLGMAFSVKVARFVQVPFAPITVPVITGAPFDVPMMDEPFRVLVVKPMIGPQVYEAAPVAFSVTVFGEPLKLFMHKVGLLGVTVTEGKPKTETVITPVLVQFNAEPNTV